MRVVYKFEVRKETAVVCDLATAFGPALPTLLIARRARPRDPIDHRKKLIEYIDLKQKCSRMSLTSPGRPAQTGSAVVTL
jgi:hypothetical protein